MIKKKRLSHLQESIIFCMRNGYKIYQVIDNGVYYVMVEYGSKRKRYHEKYTKNSIHKGVEDMYDLIYKKQKQK